MIQGSVPKPKSSVRFLRSERAHRPGKIYWKNSLLSGTDTRAFLDCVMDLGVYLMRKVTHSPVIIYYAPASDGSLAF